MSAEKKNFRYGELWPGIAPKPGLNGIGKVQVEPSRFTANRSFLKYISENQYRLFLDYDLDGFAHTAPGSRQIVVNGNVTDKMIEVLIQHELGHLMLFDVNQFVSVKEENMRSTISKVLYTVDNLRDYGLKALLKVENFIQDIIIESVSNGDCFCHNSLIFSGERAGVKHTDELESVRLISQEVCATKLKEPLSDLEKMLDYMAVGGHLRSMVQGLKQDIEEIDLEIDRIDDSKSYENRYYSKQIAEGSKLSLQIGKLEEKAKKAKDPAKLSKLIANVKAELDKVRSEERTAADKESARVERLKDLTRLEKKRTTAEELLEALMAEYYFLGDSDERLENGSISGNLTDHLLEDTEEEITESEGHSFDCGLPHPLTLERSEAFKTPMRNRLKKLRSGVRLKKMKLQEQDLQEIPSDKVKIPERESTYFKSNKRELNHSDMLKGRRKLKASGINVLIGLDISGSMAREWTVKFAELSEMVKDLQDSLSIESVIFFTYNHHLVEHSYELDDLTLQPTGGNAFGYVYQELMQKIPVLQKNEIILVTDCGDNLGFKLSDSCIAERNGVEVRNHISIIDTEEAGFYDQTGLSRDEWNLYRATDDDLFDRIRENIETLIEA